MATLCCRVEGKCHVTHKVEEQTPAAVASKADKLRAMTRDLEATKTIVREVQPAGLNYSAAQSEIDSYGILIVQIPLIGSQEIKKRYLPHHVAEFTTDSEDRLVIYMIKKDGQW
jgi:hypothetical protein